MVAGNPGRLAGMFATAVLVVVPLMAASGGAGTEGPRQKLESQSNAGKRVRHPRGRLVLMLTTGIEDVREMALSLEDAKAAKDSGYLEDVIWIARDRGVEALGSLRARPTEMVQLERAAKASGVRIIVSGAALKQYGVPADRLDPKPDEIVPDAVVRLAELISQGYQVIRY